LKKVMPGLMYVLFSLLFLVSIFSIYLVEELKQQEEQIQDLVGELDQNNESLYGQVAELVEDHDKQKMVNKELEEKLRLRYQNYLVSTGDKGAEIPVLSSSGFTPKMFERAWKEQGAENLVGSGEEFVKAEEETGVNALILAAIAVHESNWGESELARRNNNYFGWKAYDAAPLKYAASFSSRKECILTVAEEVRRNYLSRDGRHFRGENLAAVNELYATDQQWADKVARTMERIAVNAVDNPQDLENYLNRREIAFSPEKF